MKTCNRCKTQQPPTSFHVNRRNPDGRQEMCIDCRRMVDRKYYLANPDKRKQSAKSRQDAILEHVRGIKSKPCADCSGSFHPAAMQFDHVSNNKEANVSDMCRKGFSLERILGEIDKCDLVCANCHAVRTFNRREVQRLHAGFGNQ